MKYYLAPFLVVVSLLLLYTLGAFSTWQDSVVDNLFVEKQPSDVLLIVSIDDYSINQIGEWPWERDVHAQLVDTLANTGPSVIAFDVSFFEGREGDDELARSIARAEERGIDVVLAAEIVDDETLFTPIDKLKTNSSYGVVNLIPEEGGVVRKSPLYFELDNGRENSWSSEVYEKHTGKEVEDLEVPLEDNQVIINFSGGVDHIERIPYVAIIEGKFGNNYFKDRVVLVGATAKNLHDENLTPVANEPMPGVEIHGNTIDTLLKEDFLAEVNPIWTYLSIVLLGLFVFLVTSKLAPLKSFLIVFPLIILIFVIGFILFDSGVIINFIYPLFTILFVWVFTVVTKYYQRRQEVEKIKRAFSQYVSGPVLKEILNNLDALNLGGKKADMTVLFSDIRGFTTISEQLPPDVLVPALTDYLTLSSKKVFENNGVIDKYIGDAIMAFWGAPLTDEDHALNGCKTALAMLSALDNFNENRPDGIPEFKIGIGLNSGEMSVGNMGSRERFDYTVIGDNVNLGARLEGVSKMYSTTIILSEFTEQRIKDSDKIVIDSISIESLKNIEDDKLIIRFLDSVMVKGKDKPVKLYTLLRNASEVDLEVLKKYYQALGLYMEGDWQKAKKLFGEIANQDNPAKAIYERIILNEKPRKWSGSWKLESK